MQYPDCMVFKIITTVFKRHYNFQLPWPHLGRHPCQYSIPAVHPPLPPMAQKALLHLYLASFQLYGQYHAYFGLVLRHVSTKEMFLS